MSMMLVLIVPLLWVIVLGLAWDRVPRSWPWRRRLQWAAIAAAFFGIAVAISLMSNIWLGVLAGIVVAGSGAVRLRLAT
ncbi:MAG: hypothetical protein JWM47_2855 [Acidimicrobiales bacterium]|nr:hypothetical protein [Acidimicrobiales bacterium]